MRIPLLNLSRQYELLENEILAATQRVYRSTAYIMGQEVQAFEREIAQYLGCEYAVSCANGTDALVLALHAIGVGPGDEVITTPFTFFATAEAISRVGATPVFVDVERQTFNIDPQLIADKITSRTKAILPVHIFGQPASMTQIMKTAREYGLSVVEDACQAIGADCDGQKAGTLGDIGCFSFFPTKNLGAFGDGGLLTTNDKKLADILKGLRVHGSGRAGLDAFNALAPANGVSDREILPVDSQFSKYFNYLIGYNSRLDEIQAAILRVKLPYLDSWNNARKERAAYYEEKLAHSRLTLPSQAANAVAHLYVAQTDHKAELVAYMSSKGIATGNYYPVPLHLQKVYSNLGYERGDLPVSEYLSDRTLALPLFPEMTTQEQDEVIDAIYQFERERL